MQKILVVEDDVKIARFIELELQHEGFEVQAVHDGRTGLERALGEAFDLIVLDIMLPGLNGMEVCRRIRLNSEIPIIMLTAKDDTMDKVMGLDFGADDYMTKPFAIEELLARIRRIFRKAPATNTVPANTFISGNLKIDYNQYTASYNENAIELTKTEFDLLHYLAENRNIALSREQILDKVWGYDYFGETKIVDVYIRYLRSKIDDQFKTKFIHTVRGVGYLFKDEDHK
ncbi:response regulator transcription factor [Fusibacter ferrireducens]|uniref:Stage 0 sporulation protein A homolog n=1 Tax=Fusibacter ferrireducens TaxID=2785058 RepID=A0ABR9ZXY8_9FIRM|nr:response regulator transcription factor [Fusibacter ferrireducens]MBF4695338.1 response regulator transcription factor [Fusibacter ferrireducens]